MDLESEEISYLRPRDPSLNDEHLTFEAIRINLAQSESQECLGKNQASGSMQIYLRIKKNKEQSDELYEVNEKTIACRAPGSELVKRYKFSNIFQADSTQANLFNTVVKPKVFQFIGGKNSSLFAYGASGSGKTFTIMGTAAQPGIVPRTLEYLFRSLPNIPDSVSFTPDAMDNIVFLSPAGQEAQKKIHDQLLHASNDEHHVQTYKAMQQRLSTEPSATVVDQDELFLGVWVSFAEIYNEDVFDLLKPHASKKKPREKLAIKMSGTRPYIKDLTTVNISNGLAAYQLLQYGLQNLNYASTCVNFHSSRSHSVFTIKLIQGSMKTREYITSYFNFCDLAGSERLKRTLNTGERLKESNSINTSLLVLGKCIRSILCSQKFKDNRPVPYRESKLTQLFQRALRGLEDIAMIVNINPEKEVFEETLHALNFSAIAKEVKVNTVAKIVKQMENETSLDDAEIEELEDLLLTLTDELEVRESEFQDKMILMRSEMLDECNKAIAHTNKEYEKEVNRIKRYYEDLFEEEAESWKNNYKEESPSVNEDDVIVLDSSEDEESFKRSDLEKAAASPLEMQSQNEDDDCERKFRKSTSLEAQTRINDDDYYSREVKLDEINKSRDESNSSSSDGKPSLEAQVDCESRIKKSASMLEEQLKTDEAEHDEESKSKTSDKLVTTESSTDRFSELKEEKSETSFEMQDYSDDDDDTFELELKISDSTFLLEDTKKDCRTGLETNKGGKCKLEISDELAAESSVECSLFLEELNEAKTKLRESLSLFELQDYSDDGVDVVETQAKSPEDECDDYLRKSKTESTSKSTDEFELLEKLIDKTISKSITEPSEESKDSSQLEIQADGEDDCCGADSDQSASTLDGQIQTVGDLRESIDQSKAKSIDDCSPIELKSLDPTKSNLEVFSEDDHMNIIKQIFT